MINNFITAMPKNYTKDINRFFNLIFLITHAMITKLEFSSHKAV